MEIELEVEGKLKLIVMGMLCEEEVKERDEKGLDDELLGSELCSGLVRLLCLRRSGRVWIVIGLGRRIWLLCCPVLPVLSLMVWCFR